MTEFPRHTERGGREESLGRHERWGINRERGEGQKREQEQEGGRTELEGRLSAKPSHPALFLGVPRMPGLPRQVPRLGDKLGGVN